MSIEQLVSALAAIPTTDTLFNHYNESNPETDLSDAPAIRRDNLKKYLHALRRAGTRELWVFEAPSKRGALRTGVPQTSDADLEKRSAQLGIVPSLMHATRSDIAPVGPSPTSKTTWEAIGAGPIPLLWNAVMLRPHKAGALLETRAPTSAELRLNGQILSDLHAIFSPSSVIWVGEKAKKIARFAQVSGGVSVRHPAMGGRTKFLTGIESARQTVADLL